MSFSTTIPLYVDSVDSDNNNYKEGYTPFLDMTYKTVGLCVPTCRIEHISHCPTSFDDLPPHEI